MRIKSKSVNRQAIGAAQADIDAKIAYSCKEMKTLAEKRKAAGAKPGQGQTGGIHRDIVFAAVQKYGPEVMSASSDFFDALKRENPALAADGVVPGRDSINGHRSHFGAAKEKFIGGRWYHWDKKLGDWVPGEVGKRKGISG